MNPQDIKGSPVIRAADGGDNIVVNCRLHNLLLTLCAIRTLIVAWGEYGVNLRGTGNTLTANKVAKCTLGGLFDESGGGNTLEKNKGF